ncbi:MAG: glycosyltransferase family 2 protein [Leptospira sp.]|nr:glycosyltransferase family 2 protein [Leptospira sp.]
MIKLSVAIITYNEEKNIRDCIESINDLADEIIVLDSFSTDATEQIAKSFPKVKFFTHPFHGHVEQKNKAIELCNFDWILSLDADERADEILQDGILKWKEMEPNLQGYKIARLTWHMGRFIRHTGWYPKRRYRLFRKDSATWVGENPHDVISIKGEGAIFAGNIIHFSFRDFSDQIDTVNKFSSIVAFTRYKKGRKFSTLACIYKPISKFCEFYFFRRGFLDGFPGFAIAAASSFSTFLKFAKIYELDRQFIQRPSNLRESYGENEKQKEN